MANKRVMTVLNDCETSKRLKVAEDIYPMHLVMGNLRNAMDMINMCNEDKACFMGGKDGQLIMKLYECIELAQRYITNQTTFMLDLPFADEIVLVEPGSQVEAVRVTKHWENEETGESGPQEVISYEM